MCRSSSASASRPGSFLVEEFLEKRWDSPRPASGRRRGRRVLLHAPATRAALGDRLIRRVLKALLGPDAEGLGHRVLRHGRVVRFTADRYDLSMRIANLALLPQLAAPPMTRPSARERPAGIRSTTRPAPGAGPLHPVELIDRLIERAGVNIGVVRTPGSIGPIRSGDVPAPAELLVASARRVAVAAIAPALPGARGTCFTR